MSSRTWKHEYDGTTRFILEPEPDVPEHIRPTSVRGLFASVQAAPVGEKTVTIKITPTDDTNAALPMLHRIQYKARMLAEHQVSEAEARAVLYEYAANAAADPHDNDFEAGVQALAAIVYLDSLGRLPDDQNHGVVVAYREQRN